MEELGDAPSDIDPEQLRFREKINDLCRRNVGTKSREVTPEACFTCWSLTPPPPPLANNRSLLDVLSGRCQSLLSLCDMILFITMS